MEINEHGVIIDGYKIRTEQLDKKHSFEIKIINHDNKRYGVTSCNGTDRGRGSGLSLKDHNAEDLKILMLDLMRDIFKTFKDHEHTPPAILNKIIELGKGVGGAMDDEAILAKFQDYVRAEDPIAKTIDEGMKQANAPAPEPEQEPEEEVKTPIRKSRKKKQASEEEVVPVTQTPFKEGMTVKCIDTGAFTSLKLNEIYEVTASRQVTVGKTTYNMYKIKVNKFDELPFRQELFAVIN